LPAGGGTEKGTKIKRPDFRSFFSGVLPLFTVAHFGHHVVGALLRPMLPFIRRDFGLDYTRIASLQSAYALTGGISQLPSGWLADRFGPRIIVTVSVAGVALAGVGIGLSPGFTALVAFFMLAAVMEGGYHPASAAAISSSVSSKTRGRSLGIHLIGGSSAFWIIPLVAAETSRYWGWRGSYIALAIPAVALGIAIFVALGRRARTSDIEKRVAEVERPARRPPIPWRRLAPFIVMTIATGTVVQSVFGFISLIAVDNFGLSEAAAARLVAITPGIGLVAAPLGGYLSDRLGQVPVMLTVSFLAIPVIYWLGVAPNVATLVAVMIVMGLVTNIRMPTSEAYIVGHTPEGRRSTVLGAYYFASRETGGVLALVVGRMIDRLGLQRTTGYLSAALAVITVVGTLLLWRNHGVTRKNI
ncbi:MAG: MFS transporter, partial [Dehalococcoidales bacterium]